jgi:hypothetical protein
MIQEHQALWAKVQQFTFDDGTAVTTFSGKLASKQKWSLQFTQRAIEEYRRFMLICCVSANGAAPSQIVDEVWHLHLTYTQPYWIDFCRNTLGKDIHHHPSAGGTQEDHRHFSWYKETIQLYRFIFGTDPPEDIWPLPKVIVPEPAEPPFGRNNKYLAAVFLLLCFPFLFTGYAYGKVFPFYLTGPQFLWFFPIYAVSLLSCHYLYLASKKGQVEAITAAYIPVDVTPFQMAFFVYGKHRAMQTALIDLIKRGLLLSDEKQVFEVKKDGYIPDPEEKNPLMFGYGQEKDGTKLPYSDIEQRWYDASTFSNPSLLALDAFAHRIRSFALALSMALFVIPAMRLVQGLIHDKPVVFLMLEMVAVFLAFSIVRAHNAISAVVYRKAIDLYKLRYENYDNTNNQILPRFAMEGLPAISGFAELTALTLVFSAYPSNIFKRDAYDGSSGGSGCSGGGSCGGGCGGCGGGGD